MFSMPNFQFSKTPKFSKNLVFNSKPVTSICE